MQYILTLWLLWAVEDATIFQASPFASEEACIAFAENFAKQVTADGVISVFYECKPEEISNA